MCLMNSLISIISHVKLASFIHLSDKSLESCMIQYLSDSFPESTPGSSLERDAGNKDKDADCDRLSHGHSAVGLADATALATWLN